MPTNLYGPGDNYHPVNSHVIPALIRRFYEAKIQNLPFVTIWGTGNPKREFLFVDDMADACVLVMNEEDDSYKKLTTPTLSHINVGSGEDITIKQLAEAVARCVGYEGGVKFDETKPGGAPRKLLNSSKLTKMGWKPTYSLSQGLDIAYKDFVENRLIN